MVTLSGGAGLRGPDDGSTCGLAAQPPPAASVAASATARTTPTHADVCVFRVFTGVLLFMGSGRRLGGNVMPGARLFQTLTQGRGTILLGNSAVFSPG